jgi:mono/diheme cytochrome c family protein
VDIQGGGARSTGMIPSCQTAALAPLPAGGVAVACRFRPELIVAVPRAPRDGSFQAQAGFETWRADGGSESGHRGLAVDATGRFAYVASPARGGVKIVDLRSPAPSSRPGPLRFLATGAVPTTVRFVPPQVTGRARPLLLVSNRISHTVTVHEVDETGGLSLAIQTITTDAPVLDLAVTARGGAGELRASLLLTTHEDRPLSRARLAVEGLDSVLLVLPQAPPDARFPFVDPGRGRRASTNLTERRAGALVGLDALAVDGSRGRLAIVGAGSDNVLTAPLDGVGVSRAFPRAVGANPSAVAFLPDGRVATADRLSDTVTILPADDSGGGLTTITVGRPDRPTAAERGELMFYSRALVPNNVADGPLSIYTCAACHVDGHIDGRRHPSKRNRFYSMTKTCRGLLGTEPFLSVGKPDTFAGFADNIVGTHAQGALDAPETYDRYPVSLRVRSGDGWTQLTVAPDAVRAALAAYMMRIPVEPSPFAPAERRSFDAAEQRGLALFRDNCAGCHRLARATGDARAISAPVELEARLLAGQLALTSAQLYDVGTPLLGEGGNNPPSLRGVWAAAPYFSDGSAATLEDVVRRTDPSAPQIHKAENAARPAAFSARERADLLSFLRAL